MGDSRPGCPAEQSSALARRPPRCRLRQRSLDRLTNLFGRMSPDRFPQRPVALELQLIKPLVRRALVGKRLVQFRIVPHIIRQLPIRRATRLPVAEIPISTTVCGTPAAWVIVHLSC
jgi:hypothetical protein